MTMIGFRQVRVRNQEFARPDPMASAWPSAAKRTTSACTAAPAARGGPFTCGYSGRLGRARVSTKGVVTFTSRRDVNLEALTEMIAAIEAGIAAGVLTVA